MLGYNNRLHVFPTVVIGRLFGFTQREYFQTDEASREVPKVQF